LMYAPLHLERILTKQQTKAIWVRRMQKGHIVRCAPLCLFSSRLSG
jgi:hypothetical protein